MGLVAYCVGRAALRSLLRRGCASASMEACSLLLLIGLVAAPDPAVAQTFPSPQGPSLSQTNQTFNPQGPSPEFGNYEWTATADRSPNGTDAGAVESVLLDPKLGAGTMFAGGPNGGIWKTTDNGTTWKPLTDNQASLSISSLSLDPTDPSGKTIIAALGLTSSSSLSGPLNGLLYSTDGGVNWSVVGRNKLTGKTVVSALTEGNTILAATFEPNDPRAPTTGYGLFRSTDGGVSFTNMANVAGSGLPAGAITSLVADPSNPSTLYAAFRTGGTQSAEKSATAVYVSRDTGATWTPVFTSANSNNLISGSGNETTLTIAAGPNHTLAIGVIDLGVPGVQPRSVSGVFLATDPGTTTWTWQQFNPSQPLPSVLQLPSSPPTKVHVAIDPQHPNIVYLSGDEVALPKGEGCPCSASVYSLNYTTSTATSLTFEGTLPLRQDANTLHSDTRSLTFDQNGNLIVSSDGGIYMRTNPSGSGTWSGLNGNLSVFEVYSVAYDANSKRVAIAAQDNGVALQHAPGSAQFDTINGGDGTNVAINDRTLPQLSVANHDKTLAGLSAIYSTEEGLSILTRMIVNARGQVMSPGYDPVTSPGGITVYCSLNGGSADFCPNVVSDVNVSTPFSAQFVLNKVDPSLIAITGTSGVFTTRDSLTGVQGVNATFITLSLTDLGFIGGTPGVVTYGTMNEQRAIAVGSDAGNGAIWFSPNNTTDSIIQLSNYHHNTPTGLVFDTRIQTRLFAADGTNLYYTQNADHPGGGATFSTVSVPTALGFTNPTSVEFISNTRGVGNGVNALLVGGTNTPLACTTGPNAPNGCVISITQSPITVFDSDSNGNLSNPRAFGQGLPNTLVNQMVYNPTVDVLAVSSFGRGVSVLYDVTSYFQQAQALWFGLANNDSAPNAALYLNDGDGSAPGGHRPLIKYGTGLLTIAGDATYTGGTTIEGGALMLGIGGTSGSVKGNITFCSDPNDTWCDTSSNKQLGFNRSDSYAFNGIISGPGQVYQLGSGTTVMNGASTYSGPTYVNAGVLQAGNINVFSPNSFYNVASGAALDVHGFDQSIAGLAGAGSVINDPAPLPTLTILSGGTFAPGNGTAGSSMSVAANLAFQSGTFYLIQISGTAASFATIAGTATLGGATAVANYTPVSGNILKQYTILTAAGGVSGTFASLVGANFPTTLTTNLSYEAHDVFLDLALNYNALGNLNGNQQAVGNALANFFNANGTIPTNFVTLSPAGLSQVAGEAATGSQQTTFQAMTQFITTLLDPFIGGREGTTPPAQATPYAAEETGASAYASNGSSGKTLSDRERAAYAAVFAKAPLRQVYDPHWSVWASAFGGSQTTNGDPVVGSNSATSSIFGMAVGADYLLSPRTIAGFALAGGGTNFSVSGFGGGRSDLFQAGAFVRHTIGPAYVSGALAYGWQDVTTDRLVMADKLHAEFNANALSGRLEGGYRFATQWFGITPYAAAQFTSFFLPSYTEQMIAGTDPFALAYGSRTVTDTRTELGVRTDRSFALLTGLLTLRGRLAWAHDYNPDRSIAATFQALPGASFVVDGAAMAPDSALTTASAEMKWRNGWSAMATFEGEFSHVTASFAGKGVVRYVW